MSNGRARLLLMLACILGVLGGCASVPPAPPNAQNSADGRQRRVRRLAVQVVDGPARIAPQQAAPQTAAPQPARRPRTGAPGRACRAASRPPWHGGAAATPVIPASGQSPAGPPPTIPAELPSPPAGAVSIGDVKAKEGEEEGL